MKECEHCGEYLEEEEDELCPSCGEPNPDYEEED